ncbi:MAG: hypothetical protein A2504_03570 [Bdellovibrionales bacterium RIFOXYD12_FULL_39_22]|nr:MAG: hypothetical protein A2385_11320 [Bdellovibrionales bacterium RIFOXYB1_FULL_39_21]OFZ41659.1 MAG: hypothetical protein A2485_01630 [Bdellovibrionales bacterium RIFOXYC12_FULL_39_17]OFZ46059.1 MAG: hypothetical protein A2404_11995 [Bdellovibrionales bacterium RIFOXYC1_FULL_39_130]OFZ74886.1 MAG: hypothetical protein A2560_15035 [Bdellovibrionales bacterium RIFOXYD1_FULL_39_84]OFZ92739.1 MAG: hypothetical protein A2504_03570 [Bdellovibrionales bacterium RIFOXYD12_FULL_39_22]HLE12520.1 TR
MAKLFLVCCLFLSMALPAMTLKLGVVAPEGTSFATLLKGLSKEVGELTNNEVKLKIYYGGSQGDEPDVLRKIRLGQLHGGIFTGKTLGDINGDVRVMEIPLSFGANRQKALETLESMSDFLSAKMEQNGFVNLGFFEIGLVYLVSKKKISRWGDLPGIKIWLWEGDPLVTTLVEATKLVSVPLPLPDVLTSLSTGMVDAAYSPPLAILALQWNTKVKYLLDYPITYSVGAFLLDKKEWMKVPAKFQNKIMEVSKKCMRDITEANAKANQESLIALKQGGIEFISFPEEDYKIMGNMRREIITRLVNKLFTQEALDRAGKQEQVK